MTFKAARLVVNNVDPDQMPHIFSHDGEKFCKSPRKYFLYFNTSACWVKNSADDILNIFFIEYKILHFM